MELNAISVKHEEINVVKTQSLSELAAKSSDLKRLIESRKTQLDPLLKALHTLKDQCQELEARYGAQRQQYDSMVMKCENEKAGLTAEAQKLEAEYQKDESQYHSLNIQAQITEAAQNRAANELLFKASADKRLSTRYKCYTEMMKAKVMEQETAMKELKTQQRSVRESTEQNSKQSIMFGNLKRLLEAKMKSLGGAGAGAAPVAATGSEEYNRLVL